MSKKIRIITICSSASFYKEAYVVATMLEKCGLRVLLPHNAKVMARTKNYQVSSYKTWFRKPEDYRRKAQLMKMHFSEVTKGDALLVINLVKKGFRGYIGGNVLMEMALAFHQRKPIFLWNSVSKSLPVYEEVMGMLPTIINRDIRKLK